MVVVVVVVVAARGQSRKLHEQSVCSKPVVVGFVALAGAAIEGSERAARPKEA